VVEGKKDKSYNMMHQARSKKFFDKIGLFNHNEQRGPNNVQASHQGAKPGASMTENQESPSRRSEIDDHSNNSSLIGNGDSAMDG